MSPEVDSPTPTSPMIAVEPLPPQQFTAVNAAIFAHRPSADATPPNGTASASVSSPLAPMRNTASIFGGAQPSTVAPSAPVPTTHPSPTYSAGSSGSSGSVTANGVNSTSVANTNDNNGTANNQSTPAPSSTPNSIAAAPQTPVNGNGYARHDRSRSTTPRLSSATDDAWSAQDSAGNKRKRSVSPVTQTQHHHLAAHEAAMGPIPMPDHSLHRMDALSDDGDRNARGNTLEKASPNPQNLQVDPATGVRVDPKRRKRVFSNRTKTGCITCRRRKKKCDEGKPECSNCKRGGFVCEGYSGKVSWQKPPGKQIPASVSSGPPFIQSKEDQPMVDSPVHTQPISVSTPTSAIHRMGMDDRYPTRADELPPAGPSATPTQDMSPRAGTQSYLHIRGDSSASAPAPPHEGMTSATTSGSDRRVSFSSHGTLTAGSGAMVRPRSEKDKMVNSELYLATSPELVAEREACKAACWRYSNVASNPHGHVSEGEKGRMLLDILRPGNKWEVVSTGAAPGTPGAITYVNDNGYQSDIVDVTVDAPFACSYGYNIHLGKNVYIEFGCTILDSCNVTIKARTILSPNVSIYSATHPIDPRKRNGARGPEMAKPVLIEEDCWLGGNVIVLGGVTIGKGSVVGAGSVVTRDVPPFTVVAGNPARVIRGIYHNGVDM